MNHLKYSISQTGQDLEFISSDFHSCKRILDSDSLCCHRLIMASGGYLSDIIMNM